MWPWSAARLAFSKNAGPSPQSTTVGSRIRMVSRRAAADKADLRHRVAAPSVQALDGLSQHVSGFAAKHSFRRRDRTGFRPSVPRRGLSVKNRPMHPTTWRRGCSRASLPRLCLHHPWRPALAQVDQDAIGTEKPRIVGSRMYSWHLQINMRKRS